MIGTRSSADPPPLGENTEKIKNVQQILDNIQQHPPGIDDSEFEYENTEVDKNTCSLIPIASFNAASLIRNRQIKGRQQITKLLRSGCIVCIQDSQIDDKKFKILTGIYRQDIRLHPRVYSMQNQRKSGGLTFILPPKVATHILSVTAITEGILIMVLRTVNKGVVIIVNYYGKSNSTYENKKLEIRIIIKAVNTIRNVYSQANAFIAGDFNINSRNNKQYHHLCNQLEMIGLIPYNHPGTNTRYPTKRQNITQKPSCIDYIFGPQYLLKVIQTTTIPHFKVDSDHCMIVAGAKKSKIKVPKALAFPDSILDTNSGKSMSLKYSSMLQKVPWGVMLNLN